MADLFAARFAGTAIISPCGIYRYVLTRQWSEGERGVNFIMLNPSTADATADDPTIRRCIGYAKRWGYDWLSVTNLFAYRATDPRELRKVPDPIGPENDERIRFEAGLADRVVCAWGSSGRDREKTVLDLLREYDIEPHALKLTKDGHPCHPLYLPTDLEPRTFDDLRRMTDA